MLSYVTDVKNQVSGEFVLYLQLPILDHARPPVFRRNVGDGVVGESIQARILRVAGWSKSREAGIQRLNRSEVIDILKVRVGGRAAAEVISEFRVAERSVIDAISAANYSLGIGRPGKADARTKVLEVGISAGGALAINQCTRLSRGERIGRCQRKNGLGASRLVPRRFNVPTQAQVQGEVATHFEIVLHVERIVVLCQTREMGEHRQSFAIGQAEQETCKGITSIGGIRVLRRW